MFNQGWRLGVLAAMLLSRHAAAFTATVSRGGAGSRPAAHLSSAPATLRRHARAQLLRGGATSGDVVGHSDGGSGNRGGGGGLRGRRLANMRCAPIGKAAMYAGGRRSMASTAMGANVRATNAKNATPVTARGGDDRAMRARSTGDTRLTRITKHA